MGIRHLITINSQKKTRDMLRGPKGDVWGKEVARLSRIFEGQYTDLARHDESLSEILTLPGMGCKVEIGEYIGSSGIEDGIQTMIVPNTTKHPLAVIGIDGDALEAIEKDVGFGRRTYLALRNTKRNAGYGIPELNVAQTLQSFEKAVSPQHTSHHALHVMGFVAPDHQVSVCIDGDQFTLDNYRVTRPRSKAALVVC